jgi:hypothetical protein
VKPAKIRLINFSVQPYTGVNGSEPASIGGHQEGILRTTVTVIGICLCGVSLVFADNPPLPSTGYTGTNIDIAMQNWEYITSGGGGEFGGQVTPGSGGSAGQSVLTNFWCVDYQEAFSFGQSSLANITPLADVDGNSQVRYYNVTNTGSPTWLNTAIPGGANLPSDAQSRYEMAAYLVMQYDGLNGSAATPYDDTIQNAIWAITDNSGYAGGGIYEPGTQTLTSGTGSINSWVSQALANYQTVGVGANPDSWAVVSWGANSSGVLGTGPYSDTDTSDSTGGGARQTFLVELGTNSLTIGNGSGGVGGAPTPEPGFYGLLALGLGGLFFAARRKKA